MAPRAAGAAIVILVVTVVPARALERAELASGHSPSGVIAAAGGGQAVVAWQTSEGGGFGSTVELSRRGDGTWSRPEAASAGSGAGQNDKPGLGVDAHGNALLAFEGESSKGSDLYVDEVPYGQPPQKPVDFWHDAGTINGIERPCVGFDAAGDAAILWRGGSGLYISRRPAGGSFGTPRRFSSDEEEEKIVEAPRFAVAANGDAVAGGTRIAQHGGVGVWVLSHVGSSGPMQTLESGGDELGGSFATAIAPDGEAFAAWYTREPSENYDGWLTVAVRRAGASTFSAPIHVQPVPNLEGSPVLTVSSSGELTVVYNRYNALAALSRTPSGEWKSLESFGQWAYDGSTAAAYDAAGNLYVVWHHYVPGGEPVSPENGYYAAVRPAGASFGSYARISPPGSDVADSPSVAAGTSSAYAAWSLYDEQRVEAAGPLALPWPEPTPAPTTPTVPVGGSPQSPSTETAGVSHQSGQSGQSVGSSVAVGGYQASALSSSFGLRSLTADGLLRLLRDLRGKLGHGSRLRLRFETPAAGRLTIRAEQNGAASSRRPRGSALLLRTRQVPGRGSYVLNLRSKLDARWLSSHAPILLTAIFAPIDGRAVTVRLKYATGSTGPH